MNEIKYKDRCRICEKSFFEPVINIGPAPLANNYSRNRDTSEEYFPLILYRCKNCGLVQLRDIVSKEVLFKNYDYFTGETSETLPEHFESYANQVLSEVESNNPLIIGIGSNDGTFLHALANRGARVLGVDPAENIAEIAEEKGVNTIPEFFNSEVAENLATSELADVVVANNVIGHVDDLHDVIKGIRTILKDNGMFFFEVQYLPDLIDKNAFDMIYHEHRSYLSIKPLNHLLQKHNMSIVEVQRVPTQGGSIRVKAVNKSNGICKQVKEMVAQEESQQIYASDCYHKFGSSIIELRNELCHLLQDLRNEGNTIVGYGAPAKAAILLNYCNIGDDVLSFVTDEIPAKQRKFIPGTRIPIKPTEAFRQENVDYALMLAWNYKEEIVQKEKEFLNNGGKFIVPLPRPTVISSD